MSNPSQSNRRFPFVCVGMTVLWHAEGEPSYPGCPATVAAVGNQGIDLTIQEPESDRLTRKTGVRWNHEAGVSAAVRMDTGGWDFTQDTLRLRAEFPEFGQWPKELAVADQATVDEVARLEAAIGGQQSRRAVEFVAGAAGGDGKAIVVQ